MSTADTDLSTRILGNLYQKSQKGDGTDLEVKCHDETKTPTDSPDALVTFHLHATIAAESSDYFRRFPDPQTRVLEEISAKTFKTCQQYMYGQSLTNLTNETIADVLSASRFLGMDGLTQVCFEYLRFHLNHENYKTIQSLAEQFHEPKLAELCQNFRTPYDARKEGIVQQKRQINEQLEALGGEGKLIEEQTTKLRGTLVNLQKQWKSLILEEMNFERGSDTIESFRYDKSSNYYGLLLTHSEHKFTLAEVILYKLQMLYPTSNKEMNWRQLYTYPNYDKASFPCGFTLSLFWKDGVQYINAAKNLNAKFHRNSKRNSEGDTLEDELKQVAEAFEFEDPALQVPTFLKASRVDKLEWALKRQDLQGVMDALFLGLSSQGVLLLERWRIDYLKWCRENYLDNSCDHSGVAKKNKHNILTHPRGSRWCKCYYDEHGYCYRRECI